MKKFFIVLLTLAFGVAATLLVQRGLRPRTPGLIRITTSARVVSSPSVHIDGVVQEQRLVKKVYSVYPPAAEAANTTGTVLFRVLITKDGTVKSVDYLSGPSVFVESANAGVKEYRYKPTMVGDMPVEVDTIVAVPFVRPQKALARRQAGCGTVNPNS